MTDRDTGLRVTLPLVWRHNQFWMGELLIGMIAKSPGGIQAWRNLPFLESIGCFDTRAAAERAVEQAVMEKMGGVG